MTAQLRVSVLQRTSVPDVQTNVDAVCRAAEAAAAAGSNLLVAPESALAPIGTATKVAEPADGPSSLRLSEAAARSGIWIAYGFFESDPLGGPPWNTVVVHDEHGVRRATYRKVHLYDALGARESDSVRAGDPAQPPCVIDIGDFPVGVMTCFDLRFPEAARRLALHGAEAILLPAAWYAGPRKVEQLRILAAARAIENGCYVVVSDQPGPRYCGSSLVMDPEGFAIAAAPASADALMHVVLDRSLVAGVRQHMPLLGSRRY